MKIHREVEKTMEKLRSSRRKFDLKYKERLKQIKAYTLAEKALPTPSSLSSRSIGKFESPFKRMMKVSRTNNNSKMTNYSEEKYPEYSLRSQKDGNYINST
jgi:hypothetical protein